MKALIKNFIGVYLLVPLVANSQIVADLEITTNLPAFQEVNFLQRGTFTVTIFNHGPDAAGNQSATGIPNLIALTPQKPETNGYISMSITNNPNVNQDCFFGLAVADLDDPNDPVRMLHFINYRKIEPGEEITCYGVYRVGFEQGTRNLY